MITQCTLDQQTRFCKHQCEGCGWNITERNKREKMAAENKLTTCNDGLRRLIIKRKVSEK